MVRSSSRRPGDRTDDSHNPDVPERSLFIASRAEDLDLLRYRSRRRARVSIQINIPGIAEERGELLSRRLARSMAACGCNEGTVAGLIYLVLMPTLVLTRHIAASSVRAWIAIGCGLVLALVAGKLFGLVIARFTFIRTVNAIKQEFQKHGTGG
jgi:hypothetical protein